MRSQETHATPLEFNVPPALPDVTTARKLRQCPRALLDSTDEVEVQRLSLQALPPICGLRLISNLLMEPNSTAPRFPVEGRFATEAVETLAVS